MPVLVRVATRAIQGHLFGSDQRVACLGPLARTVLLDPADQLVVYLSSLTVGGVFGQLVQSEPRQRQVIHLRWPPIYALMLEVTLAASLDVGMKRGRLALQQCLIVRVADGAIDGLHALDRRVAGGAVVFQRSVRSGERAGAGLPPPGRSLHRSSPIQNAPQHGDSDQDQDDDNPFFHLNYFILKLTPRPDADHDLNCVGGATFAAHAGASRAETLPVRNAEVGRVFAADFVPQANAHFDVADASLDAELIISLRCELGL